MIIRPDTLAEAEPSVDGFNRDRQIKLDWVLVRNFILGKDSLSLGGVEWTP